MAFDRIDPHIEAESTKGLDTRALLMELERKDRELNDLKHILEQSNSKYEELMTVTKNNSLENYRIQSIQAKKELDSILYRQRISEQESCNYYINRRFENFNQDMYREKQELRKLISNNQLQYQKENTEIRKKLDEGKNILEKYIKNSIPESTIKNQPVVNNFYITNGNPKTFTKLLGVNPTNSNKKIIKAIEDSKSGSKNHPPKKYISKSREKFPKPKNPAISSKPKTENTCSVTSNQKTTFGKQLKDTKTPIRQNGLPIRVDQSHKTPTQSGIKQNKPTSEKSPKGDPAKKNPPRKPQSQSKPAQNKKAPVRK
ncbi:hypothetical protein AYI68_g3809 [Smittium mucronatum]|uniref:Uncharacterized protein n=1 Tax=Smittium mucronatum TaxID=133383 RepID=A0A1R0GLF0_9FUNG|nr:hypothetical protein AYI68_g8251 [Smittium mucronatum]OLY82077.1 hypothetical protein AYI68_g3809 [Smittium mucronatum]